MVFLRANILDVGDMNRSELWRLARTWNGERDYDDTTIKAAIRIRDGLKNVAQEIRFRRPLSRTDEEHVKTVGEAMKLLQTLGTEVTRLRQAIGIHHHDRDLRTLFKIAKTWNGENIDAVDIGEEVGQPS